MLMVGCLRVLTEDYEQLVEDIVRDGRLYASENHQEILKVSACCAVDDHLHFVTRLMTY